MQHKIFQWRTFYSRVDWTPWKKRKECGQTSIEENWKYSSETNSESTNVTMVCSFTTSIGDHGPTMPQARKRHNSSWAPGARDNLCLLRMEQAVWRLSPAKVKLSGISKKLNRPPGLKIVTHALVKKHCHHGSSCTSSVFRTQWAKGPWAESEAVKCSSERS